VPGARHFVAIDSSGANVKKKARSPEKYPRRGPAVLTISAASFDKVIRLFREAQSPRMPRCLVGARSAGVLLWRRCLRLRDQTLHPLLHLRDR